LAVSGLWFEKTWVLLKNVVDMVLGLGV